MVAHQTSPMGMALGMTLVVVGALSKTLGFQFWHYSHERESDRPIYCRKYWWVGLFFDMVVLLACDSFSYALLPLSFIAPFAGLSILFNAVLCHYGLIGVYEPLTAHELTISCIIVIGILMVALATTIGVSTRETPLYEYLALVKTPKFILLASLVGAAAVAWISAHVVPALRRATGLDRWSAHSGAVLTSATLVAACAAMTQMWMKVFSEFWHTVGRSGGGGILSGMGVAAHLGLGLFAATQLVLLQLMLGPGRALSLAVPAYQAITLLFTELVGGLLLHEFAGLSDVASAVCALGVTITLCGLALLSHLKEQAKIRRAKAGLEPTAMLPGSPMSKWLGGDAAINESGAAGAAGRASPPKESDGLISH